jgi:hypothetical protein
MPKLRDVPLDGGPHEQPRGCEYAGPSPRLFLERGLGVVVVSRALESTDPGGSIVSYELAPMTWKSWLTKMWCGQLTPMLWTS